MTARRSRATMDPAPKSLVGNHATSTSSNITVLDDIARHVDGTLVLVVKVTDGRYRRRCFLTAKAAQEPAQRATDRGENATVYLAELRPLWKIRGGDVE